MTRLLFATCVSVALAGAAALAQQPSSDVAARMGDRVFTLRELDEAWREQDAAGKAQAEQALYDGRKAALDRLVADMLIDKAAKAKGVAAEKYVADELARRKTPVTPAE